MTQRILSIDSQILNSIQNCARKTELNFIKNLRPQTKAEPLEAGSLMHQMLEIYYSIKGRCVAEDADWLDDLITVGVLNLNGIPQSSWEHWDHKQTVSLCTSAGNYYASKLSLSAETSEEIIYQFQQYAEFYQYDAWHPLAVEEVGSKVIYEDESIKIIYTFKIDLVAEKGTLIAPWDHKTSRRREEPSSLSNQFIGYCYALGLNHIVINKIGFQKSLSQKERFQRYVLNVSQNRIVEWLDNTIFWAKKLAWNLDQGYFEQNLTSCDKYSGCIYARICESDPELRQRVMDLDYIVGAEWDVAKMLETKEEAK